MSSTQPLSSSPDNGLVRTPPPPILGGETRDPNGPLNLEPPLAGYSHFFSGRSQPPSGARSLFERTSFHSSQQPGTRSTIFSNAFRFPSRVSHSSLGPDLNNLRSLAQASDLEAIRHSPQAGVRIPSPFNSQGDPFFDPFRSPHLSSLPTDQRNQGPDGSEPPILSMEILRPEGQGLIGFDRVSNSAQAFGCEQPGPEGPGFRRPDEIQPSEEADLSPRQGCLAGGVHSRTIGPSDSELPPSKRSKSSSSEFVESLVSVESNPTDDRFAQAEKKIGDLEEKLKDSNKKNKSLEQEVRQIKFKNSDLLNQLRTVESQKKEIYDVNERVLIELKLKDREIKEMKSGFIDRESQLLREKIQIEKELEKANARIEKLLADHRRLIECRPSAERNPPDLFDKNTLIFQLNNFSRAHSNTSEEVKSRLQRLLQKIQERGNDLSGLEFQNMKEEFEFIKELKNSQTPKKQSSSAAPVIILD